MWGWVKDGGGTMVIAGVEGGIREMMAGGVLGGDMGPHVCVLGVERPMLTMDHLSLGEDERVRIRMTFYVHMVARTGILGLARARLLSLSSVLPLEKKLLDVG